MAVFTIGSSNLSGGGGGGSDPVDGGSNLTTVGAIPYVSSSGVLNQDATALFWDSANDRLGVGTAVPTVLGHFKGPLPTLLIENTTSNNTTIQLKTAAGVNHYIYSDFAAASALNISTGTGTALLMSPGGTERARFAATTGNLLIGGTTDGNYKLDIQASGSTGTLRVFDQTATTGSTLAVIQAGPGQIGNLLSVRNNAGTEIAAINGSGGATFVSVNVSGSSAIQFSGRSLIYSSSDGVIRFTDNAATDFNRLQFGGTTSSFPALKRSTTILQARLADDSAYTIFQASEYIATLRTPASAAATGTAGTILWDASYVYICTATDTWKRVAIATW